VSYSTYPPSTTPPFPRNAKKFASWIVETEDC
jgi:hypothetical protein